MRNEHGIIPAGARYEANVRRREMIRTQEANRRLMPLSSISPGQWVSRGPQNCGGRTMGLLIDPMDTNILYAGAETGGVWKSTDGGMTWSPLKDFMQNLDISTMVMDPLDHNTIYVGTGVENAIPGAGVFKTIDAGLTWEQLTFTQNWQYVFKLAIQPGNSSVLLSTNPDGIWRSTDAGISWTNVYSTTIGSPQILAFDPGDVTHTHVVSQTAASSDGIHYYLQLLYSSDAGQNWTASHSMPEQVTDLRGIAVAWGPTGTVYVDVGQPFGSSVGELWRSTDSGDHYSRISAQGVTDCTVRCAVWVSPSNPNIVVVGGVDNWRSTDGGATFPAGGKLSDWQNGALSNEPHADTHWFANDPNTPNKFYVCNDGGIYRTNDITTASANSNSWTNLNASYQVTQFYGGAGIAVPSSYSPLIGGTQDNGTLRVSIGDEFSPAYRPATSADEWDGGDGGYVAIDYKNANYMYCEANYMEMARSTDGGELGTKQDITDGLTFGSPAAAQLIAPFIMDPTDTNTLLAGGWNLWRTTSASFPTPSWSAIRSAGTGAITAIAVAKTDPATIWIGQAQGEIQKTINGNVSSPDWSDIDNNGSVNPLPGRGILRILIDPADSNLVYVALGGYSIGSPSPQNLWRTTDGGFNWTAVSGSGATALPTVPISTIVRHPRNQRVLYAGTDIGIYESDDGGATWSTSQEGPADVVVSELSFVAGSELLIAATYGRGLWTVDTSSVPTFAPTNVNALATSSGPLSINVTWTGVTGATQYQVLRTSGAGYTNASGGLVTGTSYTDATVNSNTVYLYKVKAKVGGIWTDPSTPDIASTFTFTDDNNLTGKVILATYLSEINRALNAVMTVAGQSPTFTVPVLSGTSIQATDVTNLRAAMVSAFGVLGLPAPAFTSGAITAGVTTVQAAHYQEIRNAVK